MSNIETILLASASQESTFRIGSSLAASLYQKPLTIFLRGDLGAGKTTFVQGLGQGLGLSNTIVSPTYALENRFGEDFLHVDLFRIDPKEAKMLIEASDDFPGIRAIEWFDRLTRGWSERLEGQESVMLSGVPQSESRTETKHLPSITIIFTEPTPTTRTIEITFSDLSCPDQKTIEKWRRNVHLPDHIVRHCDVVGLLAKDFAQELVKRGMVVRPEALLHAGILHDLFRFLDFPREEERTSKPVWVELAKKYTCHHEEACARFLEEQGFPGLATIIRPHGLHEANPLPALQSLEQKILFYADKRVIFDKIVTIDERFDDFMRRYGGGKESEQAKLWRAQTKKLERALFGNDIP
ncbi:MAG: tRNA (adenosine(37)-N6)-threonylcarbamoyltransferase complex ATPase subunit type 1 TsaE [Patescibacteria group bacterium]